MCPEVLSGTDQLGLESSLGLVTSCSLCLLCPLKKLNPALVPSPSSTCHHTSWIVFKGSSPDICSPAFSFARTENWLCFLDILFPSRLLHEGRVEVFVYSCGSPLLMAARAGPSGPPAPTRSTPSSTGSPYWFLVSSSVPAP